MSNEVISSFDEYKEYWSFARKAYLAMDGFNNGAFLDRYGRETDDKYKSRQEIAFYINLFAPAINRYIGYLFKEPPLHTKRNKNDKIIDLILNDVDRKGNTINIFMSNLATDLKIRGVAVVLVDNFKDISEITLDEQLRTRKLPYFVNIPPENIKDYKLDVNGDFLTVTIVSTENRLVGNEVKTITIETTYTKEECVIKEDGELKETVKHNLGINPVQYVSEKGIFPAIGEFTPVAYMNKRHYNLTSELDEQLRANTFNILAINADNPKDDYDIKLSSDNALLYGKDLQKPGFIAPDIAPATAYEKRIEKLENTIKDITYNLSTNKSVESGIALSIKFDGLNSSLSNFAMKLQGFESRLFKIVAKYLGYSDEIIDVIYTKDFNIRDVTNEIRSLSELKELDYELPTYEHKKLMQIISNDLHNTDSETLDNIEKEILAYLKKYEV